MQKRMGLWHLMQDSGGKDVVKESKITESDVPSPQVTS